MSTKAERSALIARMNDALRTAGQGGQIVLSSGFASLHSDKRLAAIKAIREFNSFNKKNDPHGEHDCAILEVAGERIMFKIDYYDLNMQYLSPDPTDPKVTRRIMTIMLASDY